MTGREQIDPMRKKKRSVNKQIYLQGIKKKREIKNKETKGGGGRGELTDRGCKPWEVFL